MSGRPSSLAHVIQFLGQAHHLAYIAGALGFLDAGTQAGPLGGALLEPIGLSLVGLLKPSARISRFRHFFIFKVEILVINILPMMI